VEHRRFVRITYRDDPENGGTGYLVSGNRVLTARHVLAGKEASLEVLFDNLQGQPQKESDVSLLWSGSGELDVAVLSLACDFRLPRIRVELGDWQDGTRWRSRGWALATVERQSEGVVANMTGLSGTIFGLPPGSTHCELTVDAPPPDVADWGGISGAPVFLEGRLAAVVHEGPRAFAGSRLAAIPLSCVWEVEGFRAALGLDDGWQQEAEGRLKELVLQLARLLKRSPEAVAALAKQEPALQSYDKDGSGLAAALVDLPSWRQAVEALDQAQEQFERKSPEEELEAERVLGAVTNLLLPSIFAATDLGLFSWKGPGQVITLPAETQTFAELMMAAIDQRPMDFTEPDTAKRYPPGRARLAEGDEQVEDGFDFSGELAFWKWLDLLVLHLEPEPSHVRRVRSPEHWEKLSEILNQQIEFDIENGERRRYFLFSEEFALQNRAFLELVKKHLPSLHLVQREGGDLIRERNDLKPLRRILFRPVKRRKKP
jgi:hypothetical protein